MTKNAPCPECGSKRSWWEKLDKRYKLELLIGAGFLVMVGFGLYELLFCQINPCMLNMLLIGRINMKVGLYLGLLLVGAGVGLMLCKYMS